LSSPTGNTIVSSPLVYTIDCARSFSAPPLAQEPTHYHLRGLCRQGIGGPPQLSSGEDRRVGRSGWHCARLHASQRPKRPDRLLLQRVSFLQQADVALAQPFGAQPPALLAQPQILAAAVHQGLKFRHDAIECGHLGGRAGQLRDDAAVDHLGQDVAIHPSEIVFESLETLPIQVGGVIFEGDQVRELTPDADVTLNRQRNGGDQDGDGQGRQRRERRRGLRLASVRRDRHADDESHRPARHAAFAGQPVARDGGQHEQGDAGREPFVHGQRDDVARAAHQPPGRACHQQAIEPEDRGRTAGMDAHDVGRGAHGLTQCAGGEVHARHGDRPDKALEQRAHLHDADEREDERKQPHVNEARGHQPPPLAVSNARPVRRAPGEERLRKLRGAVGEQDAHEHDRVHPDEDRRDDEPGRPRAQGRTKRLGFRRAALEHGSRRADALLEQLPLRRCREVVPARRNDRNSEQDREHV
jgi:hypothetical protein